MSLNNELLFIFPIGGIFCIIGAVFIKSCARLDIALYDIYKNLQFILKEKNEPFPFVKVLFESSAILLSIIMFAYSQDKKQFVPFLLGFFLMILSSYCLFMSIVRWFRKYVENVSEFIASCRYQIQDSNKEHREWKEEQEQWLLLLDVLGDEITRESFILIDKEICGKKQPLTIGNRWKLEALGYKIDDIGKAQIRLSNTNSICPI